MLIIIKNLSVKMHKLGRNWLILFIAILFWQNVCAEIPQTDEGLFYIALRNSVEIDSSLSEWQSIAPVKLDQKSQTEYKVNDWGGVSDLSGKFWIGWNSWGLALAAEVIDDSLSFPFTGIDVWRNDCFQFAIDLQDDNNPNSYQNDDREFVVTFADSEAIVYEYDYTKQRTSGYRDFPVAIRAEGNKLQYEVLIPWYALGILEPPAGKHIGVSVVFFDNDGDDFRGWIQWTTGITRKKFTLPFATVVLFDPNVAFTQAIPTKTFLSTEDTLSLWTYCRYYRKNVEVELKKESEVLFRKSYSLKRQKWTRITIPPKFLTWGNLTLKISSPKMFQQYQISIWSKKFIAEQIDYLSQQAAMMKNVKQIGPEASILVENWIDLLQRQLSAARTDFDYFQIMMSAKKRIELIPNFYMKKQVYFDRENHILEKFYFSEHEQRYKRYFLFLPPDYDKHKAYPIYLFLHDERENGEVISRRMGNIFTQQETEIIGIFFNEIYRNSFDLFGLAELKSCLEHVKKNFTINQERIYLAGQGDGARLALRWAKSEPDRFAALTLIDPDFQVKKQLLNIALTPTWIDIADDKVASIAEQIDFLRSNGGKVHLRKFRDFSNNNFESLFTSDYVKWLFSQKYNHSPEKIKMEIHQLKPTNYGWADILGMENYGSVAFFNAKVDSYRIMISAENLSEFSISIAALPKYVKFPVRIYINGEYNFKVNSRNSNKIHFAKISGTWEISDSDANELKKRPHFAGPMNTIFDRKTYYVYGTLGEAEKMNQLTYELARKTVQRENGDVLKKLLLPDTTALKKNEDVNFVVFGNFENNAFLKQIRKKLPFQPYTTGLQFGKMFYPENGSAALYLFPNPEKPKKLLLVGFAQDTLGMKNISQVWQLKDDNLIFAHDFVVVGKNASAQDYSSWTDYGWFDHFWSLPHFKPPFKIGPKYWTKDITVGLDANQLAFNSNWKGGGKSNFTWKIYSRMNFLYKRKKYNWKNSLYLAFGQITVKEDEKWRSPEKSTDVIDFDSVLKFTLEKFIDPYLAFSASTQFHEGYDAKTKKLISRFANPLKMSQSAGIARNIVKKKKLKVTTRLGYASNEFIATQQKFRKLWTGDESRGIKIDGGVEWMTEYHSELKKGTTLDGKLKLFQAVISSISKEKDPQENWRKLDVYWEQRLNIRLTQYVVFNAIVKFIYDRDTTPGGQFWENASFGLSYKF